MMFLNVLMALNFGLSAGNLYLLRQNRKLHLVLSNEIAAWQSMNNEMIGTLAAERRRASDSHHGAE